MSISTKTKAAKNVVTSKAGRQILKGKKHSPHILFGTGVIGFAATVVLASRATLKLENVLQEHEDKQGEMHDAQELARLGKVVYTAREQKKDETVLKARLAGDIAKLYAPAFLVGTGTILAFGSSHIILSKRNAALMAAYAALDRGYSEYRQRVLELVGEEKERELRFGSETREVAVDGPNGVEVHTEKHFAGTGASPYARLFAKDTSAAWDERPEYNLVFLRSVQTYMNDTLKAKGSVLLNDVYDALGLERTQPGCVVGWVKGNGDGFVDFGIYDDKNPLGFHSFMTGNDDAILLDFNVDGVVYNLI